MLVEYNPIHIAGNGLIAESDIKHLGFNSIQFNSSSLGTSRYTQSPPTRKAFSQLVLLRLAHQSDSSC